jgi:hypothetical protein
MINMSKGGQLNVGNLVLFNTSIFMNLEAYSVSIKGLDDKMRILKNNPVILY